ncbi:MAG: HigA family addiction module antitoxin [Elusimicrobiota bacterium]
MIPKKRAPTHPGGILKRHYLGPLSLTISRTAIALGVSRKTVSKIVNERGDVTPDMALRLARTFRTTPELWLNLQRNHDLWHASHDSHRWQRARVIVSRPAHAGTSDSQGAWAF